MVMSLLESLYKSLYKNVKDPALSIFRSPWRRRKVASLRPPFSTPLRSLGEPDPDTPFLVPIEHAPPLFVRIWEDKISLKTLRRLIPQKTIELKWILRMVLCRNS